MIWLIFLFILHVNAEDYCSSRKVQYGFVCVCNSTYCDTVPEIGKILKDEIKVYYTSNSKPGFNVQSSRFSNSKDSSIITIHINDNITYQKILGFGGAFTDSTGLNIEKLPEAAQTKLLESYFGDSGISYSVCRVPIGGTDFSTRKYSYDDVDGDTNLQHFSLQIEDLEYKVGACLNLGL